MFPYGTTGEKLRCYRTSSTLETWIRLQSRNRTRRWLSYEHSRRTGKIPPLSGNKAPIQDIALEPGMIITDEPGVYIAGSHGIRTENELMICEGETTAYGRFLYF